MALAGTHVQFALDVKEKYKPDNISEYILGTLYPDSRYTTGIDRNKTHFDELLDVDEAEDDFKKGWACHYLCDKVMNEVFWEWFPDVFKKQDSYENWVRVSALKVLVDLEVLAKHDLNAHFVFDELKTPFDEDPEKMKQFYHGVASVYHQDHKPTLTESVDVWENLGVKRESCDEIQKTAETYRENKEMMQKIAQVYPEMLRRALK